jgi:hypothetical protein
MGKTLIKILAPIVVGVSLSSIGYTAEGPKPARQVNPNPPYYSQDDKTPERTSSKGYGNDKGPVGDFKFDGVKIGGSEFFYSVIKGIFIGEDKKTKGRSDTHEKPKDPQSKNYSKEK